MGFKRGAAKNLRARRAVIRYGALCGGGEGGRRGAVSLRAEGRARLWSPACLEGRRQGKVGGWFEMPPRGAAREGKVGGQDRGERIAILSPQSRLSRLGDVEDALCRSRNRDSRALPRPPRHPEGA